MDEDLFPADLTGNYTAQDPAHPTPPPSRPGPAAVRPDESRQRRRYALLFAAVPWLVLAAILLRPAAVTSAGDLTAPTSGPDTHASEDHASERPTPTTSSEPPSAVILTPANGGHAVHGNVATPRDLAGATAVVVARAHLGTAGPALEVPGIERAQPGGYVEHVAVERVDMPAPGAAVVTVVAVVLTATADTYDGVDVVRLAVPVVFTGDLAVPGGQPWRLPAPSLQPATPQGTPEEAPDLVSAASEALLVAGYAEIEDLTVATTDGWPVLAEATAIAPGDTEARRHLIWMRRHLGALAVAGTEQEQGQ